MNQSTLKSIGAVTAGLFFIIITSNVVDLILHAAGIYPPVPEPLTHATALIASSYRLLIGIAGAYLTAKLAPQRPFKHAMILSGIGTLLGVVGVVVTWNLNLGPRWYAISLPLLAVPQCWLGGWLYERNSSRTALTTNPH